MASIASGPPGIESKHVWNGFTLNDLTARPTRVRLYRIQGIHGLPEADDNRSNKTGVRGETVYPGSARGKTVVYEGAIQSKTLDGLRVMSTALRGAFRGRSLEGAMTILGNPQWFFQARVMQLDMDDEQTVGMENMWPYQRDFSLGLRMGDSRFFALPIVNDGAASNVARVLTNPGNTDTPPYFQFTANGATATLSNANVFDDTGAPAQLIINGLTAGQVVKVDFSTHTILVNDVDATGLLDVANCNWWDENVQGLRPSSEGTNSVKVVGGAWTVKFWPASE